MICRHCGIEFDTSGITGDVLRCPGCGMLYRRKAPVVSSDPRTKLTVPVFIRKGQELPAPKPMMERPEEKQENALKAQPTAPWGISGKTGQKPERPAAEPVKRKKTHHIRTALILALLLVAAVTALTLTGFGDVFPRAADEVHETEELVTEEPAEEETTENIEWFG